jgi:hypothetical protein
MRRRAIALTFMALAGAALLAPAPALAQRGGTARLDPEARPEVRQLRERAEARFQVVEVKNGIILIPKSESSGARTIDVNDGRVLIDGAPVTGRELRERLGSDADLVLQLSFLDAGGRRAFFAAPSGNESAPEAPSAAPPQAPAPDTTREEWKETARYRHGGARVRFGGDVSVDEDEAVRDDVVVIFGSAHINGRVDGAVVAVGGSVILGAKAHVVGDVTAVGGGIERASGAVVEGESNEVRFSSPHIGPFVHSRPWREWRWLGDTFQNPFSGSVDLLSTLVRMGLVALFAALVVAVAPAPVKRVADRVTAEPWRAGLVGLAAQLLFVPLLVLTVVILAISIIGIPLLLLVPFGILVVAFAFVMGLAGTGCAIGQWVSRRAGSGTPGLLASLVIGLAVVFALTVVARFAGLAGLPVRVIVGSVLLAGLLVEYVAWTVGVGAVVLSRFGKRSVPATVPDVIL